MVEDMECMFQLLSPMLDALGSPRETPGRWEEFVKSWPRQWLAEKAEGFEGERCPLQTSRGSSGDEFLCPDCGDMFPDSQETEVPSRQGTQRYGSQRLGSCVMACAPQCRGQLSLQDKGYGAFWRRVRRAAGRR